MLFVEGETDCLWFPRVVNFHAEDLGSTPIIREWGVRETEMNQNDPRCKETLKKSVCYKYLSSQPLQIVFLFVSVLFAFVKECR